MGVLEKLKQNLPPEEGEKTILIHCLAALKQTSLSKLKSLPTDQSTLQYGEETPPLNGLTSIKFTFNFSLSVPQLSNEL